jgi:predicted permease
LSSLLGLFANNILPILIVAAVGVLLQRIFRLDVRTFSQAIIYVLAPCLIFTNLAFSDIAISEMLLMVALALLLILCMGAISYVASRLLRLPAKLASVFIITTTFMNAGNFGLAFTDFTLGSNGLAWASIFFVTSATMMNSAGIYIATAGAYSPLDALRKLARFPAIYAIPLALIVRATGFVIPLPILRPIELLSDAAVPTMLLLLGMQIADNGMPEQKGILALSTSLRLLASPLIAWLLASSLGLAGIARDAAIIEAAMPTAVFTAVLAHEFDLDSSFATSAIFASTLLSPLTLTLLISLLGS